MDIETFFPKILDSSDHVGDRFVHFTETEAAGDLRLIQFGVQNTIANYGYGPSARDHHVLHFVFSGGGEVSLEDRRFRVQENELFFLPANCVSYYEADADDPWRYAWIGFSGTAGDAALGIAGLSPQTPVASISDPVRIENMICRMENAMFEKYGYFSLMNGLYALLAEVTKVTGRMPEQDHRMVSMRRQSMDRQINAVLRRIERDFDQPLRVDGLAEEVGLARSYLSEQFKKRTGRSIKEYITMLRMDRAKVMLMNRNATTKSVAAQCGYDDPQYFSRIFKKYVGIAPSDYRERLKDG